MWSEFQTCCIKASIGRPRKSFAMAESCYPLWTYYVSNPSFSVSEFACEQLQVVLIYSLSTAPCAACEPIEASDWFAPFDHSDPVQFPLK